MSETNETSRELTEAELDTVTGGSLGSIISHIAHTVSMLVLTDVIPEAG